MQLLSRLQWKMDKSNAYSDEYLSKLMHLLPYKLSGVNFCSHASNGCATACLNKSGMGRTSTAQLGRLKRSRLFIEDRNRFKRQLIAELNSFVNSCEKVNKKPAFRPNGTSDLPWETIYPDLFSMFPEVQFYDYTKVTSRMIKYLDGDFPSNYHLTYSRSEVNHEASVDILNKGGNVAIVFDKLPETYLGFPVHNGDIHDLRFLDDKGIVGLTPKALAKKDKSGFMVNTYYNSHINRLVGRRCK